MSDRADWFTEEIRVTGNQLVETVNRLVREGNVRRLRVRNAQGRQLLEVPLTVGVVGVLVAPVAAALGALAALVSGLVIEVERVEDPGTATPDTAPGANVETTGADLDSSDAASAETGPSVTGDNPDGGMPSGPPA